MIKQATKTLDTLDHARQMNNGEMVNYYNGLMPGRTMGEKVSDWTRTAMLSSPAGRLHALGSTAMNVLDKGPKDAVAAGLGKVHNFFAAPEKAVRDTGMDVGKVVKGAITGTKQTANESKGNFLVDNAEKMMKDGSNGNSSQMNAFSGGPIKKFVNAATHTHSNLTQGIIDSEVARDARVEGMQQDLSGEELDNYTNARAAQQSPLMKQRADQVHLVLNNLNDNPISRGIARAAGAFGNGTVGTIIKNQIAPFPKFVGGHMWNSITDKNVVAAGLKILGKAVTGKTTTQGLIDDMANFGIEGAKAYGLGWVLTQNGVLTNKDAKGKTYDGVYLHIGDRYIPATTLGFLAPSIILGNAAYNGFNTDPKDVKGNFVDHLGKTVATTLGNAFKAYSGADVFGAGDTLAKPFNAAFAGGGPADPAQLAKLGSNIVNQNIPAGTGDVNAVLNNGLGPIPAFNNPTHEAAATTVTKLNPDTGHQKTDPLATAAASIQNKIPFASQGLPRQAGVASADVTDKILHSDRETGTEVKAAATAKTLADQTAADKAGDIPDPNGNYNKVKGDTFETAVQARIDRGEYDKASAGLQQKLDSFKGDNNVAKKTVTDLQTKIKELGVLKAGNWDPSIIDTYKSTTNGDWQKMGDPNSDTYDPKTFDMLWQYDSQLAKAGASGDPHDPTNTKYTAKAAGKGRGGSGSTAGGGIGSLVQLNKVSLGNLAPQKITNATMPMVAPAQPGSLIKARAISVSKTR